MSRPTAVDASTVDRVSIETDQLVDAATIDTVLVVFPDLQGRFMGKRVMGSSSSTPCSTAASRPATTCSPSTST